MVLLKGDKLAWYTTSTCIVTVVKSSVAKEDEHQGQGGCEGAAFQQER